MSELQIALLSIGVGVVVAVYFYGWWQQRQYRKKFGDVFKAEHEDVLYQERSGRSVASSDVLSEPVVANPDEPGSSLGSSTVIPGAVRDESCALLDAESDFVIELQLAEPESAAILDGLWQRKFDFGKPLHVCGLTLSSGQWERVIAESQTLYTQIRIALQLVDRSGAVTVTRLADFRDLVLHVVKKIKADSTVPDIHETHQRALKLDALCVDVDQMVGLNLLPTNGRLLSAVKISQAALVLGMTLEADGAFHLLNAQGQSLFSLSSMDSKPFQHHTLEASSTDGITLLLDVPRVVNPVEQFDGMVRVARQLAVALQLNVVDDHRVLLSDAGLSQTRAQITEVENRMLAGGIVPGSAQARRLFS